MQLRLEKRKTVSHVGFIPTKRPVWCGIYFSLLCVSQGTHEQLTRVPEANLLIWSSEAWKYHKDPIIWKVIRNQSVFFENQSKIRWSRVLLLTIQSSNCESSLLNFECTRFSPLSTHQLQLWCESLNQMLSSFSSN